MRNFIVDVTDVALEWAEKNVNSNPHLSELIEIRKASSDSLLVLSETTLDVGRVTGEVVETFASELKKDDNVLIGVVRDDEHFDFCMCNPPFFESMEEAGLNPKTACGGTPEEMVCPGGERAFIMRIIDDSVVLKQSFR